MPTHLLYQCRLEPANQKVEDSFINTFHFQVETLPPAAGTLTAIQTAIFNFYSALKAYIPSSMVTGNIFMKVYNWSDPKPRVPITTLLSTLTGMSSSAPVPPEVCVTVSYNAPFTSGTKPARRRGRIYFGPTIAGMWATGGKLATVDCNTIATAARALLTASDAAADWTWVQYSPTNDLTAPVSAGWVDDAADIQRRRGRLATVRAIYP